MTDDLERPGPFAERLLGAERRRPAVPDEVASRLLVRIGASVAAGGAAASATGNAAASAKAAAAKGAAAKAAAIGLTSKAAPWIALAFVAGGGTGAAIHASFVPATVVVSPSPVASPSPAPSSAPEHTVAARSAPPAASSVASAAAQPPLPASTPSLSPDLDLAAERALVERARTALARDQASAALEAVDAHAARFPRGRLSEEREAIAIQALAKIDRPLDARRRADAFRKAHPNSVFLPAIELAAPPP
ncbi:MAG TPA: hypothetical protein VM925_30525 [Labilithrix sp.]|nr:hypothetical protein [Labilithrix sp.]